MNGDLDDCGPKGLRRRGLTPSGQLRGKINYHVLEDTVAVQLRRFVYFISWSQGITHWI